MGRWVGRMLTLAAAVALGGAAAWYYLESRRESPDPDAPAAHGRAGDSPEPADELAAWKRHALDAAERAIRPVLTSPRSAEFEPADEFRPAERGVGQAPRYVAEGDLFARNAFGAEVRGRWRALLKVVNGKPSVLSVEHVGFDGSSRIVDADPAYLLEMGETERRISEQAEIDFRGYAEADPLVTAGRDDGLVPVWVSREAIDRYLGQLRSRRGDYFKQQRAKGEAGFIAEARAPVIEKGKRIARVRIFAEEYWITADCLVDRPPAR